MAENINAERQKTVRRLGVLTFSNKN